MSRSYSFLSRSLLALLISATLFSCEKDDDNNDQDQDTVDSTTAVQTYPTPADADAVLVAVRANTTTDTPIGPIDIQIGTAVAIRSDDGFITGTFVPMGQVLCNTQALTQNPNNSYVFSDISPTSPMGISFSSEVDWSVSGGNGFDAIDYDAFVFGFPTTQAITSEAIVNRSLGYTLSCSGVSGADSVLFNIGNVMKTLSGSSTSYTFTADELSALGAGSGVAQISAYTTDAVDFADQKVYFINQDTRSLTVTIE